jgi:hypothetical protein
VIIVEKDFIRAEERDRIVYSNAERIGKCESDLVTKPRVVPLPRTPPAKLDLASLELRKPAPFWIFGDTELPRAYPRIPYGPVLFSVRNKRAWALESQDAVKAAWKELEGTKHFVALGATASEKLTPANSLNLRPVSEDGTFVGLPAAASAWPLRVAEALAKLGITAASAMTMRDGVWTYTVQIPPADWVAARTALVATGYAVVGYETAPARDWSLFCPATDRYDDLTLALGLSLSDVRFVEDGPGFCGTLRPVKGDLSAGWHDVAGVMVHLEKGADVVHEPWTAYRRAGARPRATAAADGAANSPHRAAPHQRPAALRGAWVNPLGSAPPETHNPPVQVTVRQPAPPSATPAARQPGERPPQQTAGGPQKRTAAGAATGKVPAPLSPALQRAWEKVSTLPRPPKKEPVVYVLLDPANPDANAVYQCRWDQLSLYINGRNVRYRAVRATLQQQLCEVLDLPFRRGAPERPLSSAREGDGVINVGETGDLLEGAFF